MLINYFLSFDFVSNLLPFCVYKYIPSEKFNSLECLD